MSLGDNTTKSTSSIPDWMESGSKKVTREALDFFNQDYKKTPARKRVAPFNSTQMQAFAGINDWASQPFKATDNAIAMTGEAASAPRFNLTDYGRIVDEDGALGAMSDYINPYVEESLQPALREIRRSADAERMRIGDMAGGASAYGDARHGVLEGVTGRNELEKTGDLAYQGYRDAWDQAMGLRSGDLARFVNRDLAEGQFYEQALGRKMSGAESMAGLESQQSQNKFQQLMGMLSAGNIQQQHKQSKKDVRYQDREAARQDEYDKLAAMVSVLAGVPFTRTQTTTTPNNDLFSLFGAAAGGLF